MSGHECPPRPNPLAPSSYGHCSPLKSLREVVDSATTSVTITFAACGLESPRIEQAGLRESQPDPQAMAPSTGARSPDCKCRCLYSIRLIAATATAPRPTKAMHCPQCRL